MIRKIFQRIRRRIFPSQIEKNSKKWHQDGGDDRYRFDYCLDKSSLILDVGGYDGQWTSDIFSRFTCKIYVFEPVQVFSENISNRFMHNSNIIVQSFALGLSSRSEFISINSTGSSVYKDFGNKQKIDFVDVKKWFQENRIDTVDLMKVNIEGGEYELLDRMLECGLMDKVKNLQVQFHEIDKHSKEKMKSLQDRLRGTHELTFHYEFIWENWKIKEELANRE